MVVLKNLSERIKFLKTKEGIITFKAGEEKEVDCNLINLKNLPNNLVIKNDQEAEVKDEKETEKIEEPEQIKEEGSTEKGSTEEPEKEPEKEPEQEIEDPKTIIEKEIESLRVKFESVNGKRQKEAINNKIIELEAKLKELN